MADAFEPSPRSAVPAEKRAGGKADLGQRGWTVIVPVPKIAPPPPAQPYKHGKPAATIPIATPGPVAGYMYRLDP